MKIRALACAVALAMSSTLVSAQNYQAEIGAAITDVEDSTVKTVFGAYHFSEVSTQGRPLAEAAYLGKSNNVQAALVNSDYLDTSTIAAEFYVGGKYYVAPSYVDVDGEGYSDGIFMVGLGMSPMPGLLVQTLVPEDNYDLNIRAKYVSTLSSGNFFNFEASYQDGGDFDDTLTLGGDYYLDASTSVGAALVNASDTGYSLRANKFFTPTVRGGVEFNSVGSSNALTIVGSFRL